MRALILAVAVITSFSSSAFAWHAGGWHAGGHRGGFHGGGWHAGGWHAGGYHRGYYGYRGGYVYARPVRGWCFYHPLAPRCL